MNIKVESEGRRAIVYLSGSVDIPSADRLKQTLDQIAESKLEEVIIDFEGVNSIGSSGIEALRLFDQKIVSTGGRVRVVNLSKEIKLVFTSNKLDKLFNI